MIINYGKTILQCYIIRVPVLNINIYHFSFQNKFTTSKFYLLVQRSFQFKISVVYKDYESSVMK